ncbi:hypothetical protein DFP72DRAFT_792664, partial [Ephemerocybe angulata]
LVLLFIKHICGWTEDGPKRGLFGTPAAFYGTVEQQGRMTLHLHFLLWIAGQLPLHIVREKLMSQDSDFTRELTEYMESCFVGEFMTGSKAEVSDHDIPEGYKDPTLTLPEAPPQAFCDEPETCGCENCVEVLSWWERFKLTVDDILIRSNKIHATGKGCINKDGVCTARFPREVFMQTTVDPKTGHLNMKKQESSINDVSPVVTATNRCNTDARCLLSGTSVKAVVGYVTDYITKGWLKTHQVFSALHDSFSR